MPKQSVYLETTIISYLTARPSRDLIVAARQQITREWWEARSSAFELFVSSIVIREVNEGDVDAVMRRNELLENILSLEPSTESERLTKSLLANNVFPKNAVEDAAHLAIAAVNGIDYLLTWNQKHLANAQLQKRMESVCRDFGVEPPVVCDPEQLMEG